MARHPYYPQSLSIPHFVPQNVPMEKILFTFFSGLLILTFVFLSVYARRPSKGAPAYLALWFFMCGLIHTFVEGYFVATNATIAGDTTFLANLWKEYAKSDSRYMISDPTVLLIEGITAVRKIY